jgi:WD40 repeat protein
MHRHVPILSLIAAALAAATGLSAAPAGQNPVKGNGGPAVPGARWEASVGSVTSKVAFSPDGRLVAVSADKVVKLLDASSGHLVRTIAEPDTPRSGGVAFSSDGRLLATGRLKPPDSRGRIWGVADGRVVRTLENAGTVETVAFSPRVGMLATTGYGTPVSLWDIESGTRLRALGQKLILRFCIAFSPDGELVASAAARPNTLLVWRVQDGEPVRVIGGFSDFIESVAFSPDGKLIACGTQEGEVAVYRVSDGTRAAALSPASPGSRRGRVNSVAFSPDGGLLLAGGSAPAPKGKGAVASLRLWGVGDARLLHQFAVPGEQVMCVAFSPKGDSFAYCGSDGAAVCVDRAGLTSAPR